MLDKNPNRHLLRFLVQQLEAQQLEVDYLVGATPSGNTRNLLTEANINLMLSISKLKEILKLL